MGVEGRLKKEIVIIIFIEDRKKMNFFINIFQKVFFFYFEVDDLYFQIMCGNFSLILFFCLSFQFQLIRLFYREGGVNEGVCMGGCVYMLGEGGEVG